ncbi:MAG: DegT/DnrJ/EryC1/StrS family aminotransferase [Bryobacter sp.]|nr:DegT/DnrJ/EryC1/StrS family aminotransferase [Bryobacter sp.]
MSIPIADLKPALAETRPDWEDNLAALFARGFFVLGPELVRFETAFAEALGAKSAIGVSSGSTAIELCLRDAGVANPRQEVLTSALTAPFTAVSIAAAGGTPKFADVDPDTLQISAGDLGNRITKRTAALLPVHLYGQPCRIDKVARLAKSFSLPLVQDACQSHFARFRGKPLTDFSPYVAYSFYPTKNLGCLGDGGAIATRSLAVAKRLRQLRDGGRGTGPLPHSQIAYVARGINARLDEMQACFLNAFLPRAMAWTEARRRLATLYDDALAGLDAVRPLRTHPCTVRHLYVVRAKRRDRLRAFVATKGIGTGIHYPVPLHLHPAFAAAGQKKGTLPVAEKACREILSLPLYPHLAESAVVQVVEAIREFYSE